MIRFATTDDIQEILRIEQLCFNYDIMTKEEAEDFIAKSYLWVFERKKVLGFLILEDEYIYSLATDPIAQGLGIGRSLVLHAQSLKPRLSLHVKTDNIIANRLYRRLDFYEIARHPDFYDDGSEAFLFLWRK